MNNNIPPYCTFIPLFKKTPDGGLIQETAQNISILINNAITDGECKNLETLTVQPAYKYSEKHNASIVTGYYVIFRPLNLKWVVS